jgi:outer membrane protein assembly factor BamE (lipoprotein component of BamABCDE complex)
MKNLLIILIVLFAAGCGPSSSPILEPFTKEAWLISDGELPYNHRAQILGDLQQNYLSVEMNKSDVINLLGEPEQNGKRLIGYIFLEDDDDFDGELWTWKLKFLLDKDGQKVIKIYTSQEISTINKHLIIYEAILNYAKTHFDTNYIFREGTVGKVTKYIGKDGKRYYEQKHLGLPTHKDSLHNQQWTYYQLNEKIEVLSYSNKSMAPTK